MQTFRQFISEAEDQSFDDFLQEHCTDFMREIGADLSKVKMSKFSLYRGIRTTGAKKITLINDGDEYEAYIKNVRGDRKTLDTSPVISKLVDDVLEEKFGWRPRSQSVFCFTHANRGGTQNYGMSCRIYPMGKIQYVYSPTVRDLTLQISRWLDAQGLKYIRKGSEIPPDDLEAYKFGVKSFIDHHNYTNTGLEEAMTSGGDTRPEVMVKCSQYTAIGDDLF